MSKNFEQIFSETYKDKLKPEENLDSEGYAKLDIGNLNEAQMLVMYVIMNEGALRERDRILGALSEVDASWVTYAMDEIRKIPRDLPRE